MRRLFLLLLAAALLLLALPAAAAAARPNLLAISGFAVKPSAISTITGDGTEFLGDLNGHSGPLTWGTWSSSKAAGAGKIWINDGDPNVAKGHYHSHKAAIRASRVRSGHFTRMTVRFRGGPHEWDGGTTLYVDHYRLVHFGSGDFTWKRSAR
jgi:hypothetical protein